MKWEDISKKLRGRSAISCRLHYQNYLERRSEWDEEKRNRLARVYDRYVFNHPSKAAAFGFGPDPRRVPSITDTYRLKHDLWNPIANELGIPWRACEAMHWAMGEHEMARRANAIPFAIAAAQAEPGEPGCGRVAQRDRMLKSTFIQMSKEMWDFDAEGSGELIFDKVIDGFLPELFKRWRELKVKHLVSIILFKRMIYDRRKHADSATSGLDAIEPHYRAPGTATTSKDFYRDVVSDTASGRAFFPAQIGVSSIPQDISIRPPDAGSHLPCGPATSSTLADTPSRVIAGHPSAATRGNVLEAINLASSQFPLITETAIS
jgi:hypothetical protein